MALVNQVLGAPITISIGAKGQRPDFYAGRIVTQPRTEAPNGRPGVFAQVIYRATNLAGEEYLAERTHNLAFAFDRKEREPMIDGTPQAPKTVASLIAERAEATMAFLMSRPEASDSLELDDLAI